MTWSISTCYGSNHELNRSTCCLAGIVFLGKGYAHSKHLWLVSAQACDQQKLAPDSHKSTILKNGSQSVAAFKWAGVQRISGYKFRLELDLECW